MTHPDPQPDTEYENTIPIPQFLLSNLETLGLRSNILEEKWSAGFLACGFVLRVFGNYAV